MAPRNDSDTWFVCIDPSDKGKSTAYLETVDFLIQVAPSDPNYGTLESGGTINWNGMPLIRWKGPYATEAEGKSAQLPQQQSPNPVTDAKNALLNSNANPLDALGDIANFFDTLTQANTWKRVGLVAGGLIVVGLSLKAAISGQTPVQAAKQTAKTAVKTAAVVAPK